MIATTLSAVNPWPRELLKVIESPIVPSLNQVRFDTLFSKFHYENQLNTTSGIFTSVPVPGFLISPNQHPLINYPDYFPLNWVVGASDDSFGQGEIVTAEGVSGFTVFPSHSYPKHISKGTYFLEISCMLTKPLLLKDVFSVNSDWNGYYVGYEKFIEALKNNNATLTGNLSSWTFDYAYSAGGREDFEIISISPSHSANSFNFTIPSNVDPRSIEINLPITNIDPTKSPYGYTGDSTYTLYDQNRNGVLKGIQRSDLLPDPIIGTINYNTGAVAITYTNGYLASAGSVFLSYRTTPKTYEVSAKNVYNNNWYPYNSTLADHILFSSVKPIYLYDLPFRFVDYSNPISTINWFLSSFPINNGSANVVVSSVMVDNLQQNSWHLKDVGRFAQIKFENNTNESPKTLSAFNNATNEVLVENQWYPASTDIKFSNSGFYRSYNTEVTLSSVNDYIEICPVDFNLNNALTTIVVNVLSSDANNALIQATSEATLHSPYGVKWVFDPPDNIVIKSAILTGNVIPHDTWVSPSTAMLVYLSNLGVEDTIITLSSQEYGASGRAKWFSSQVLSSLPLTIFGDLDVVNETRTGSLSAKLLKNNLYYPIPSWSNIEWAEWHSPKSEAIITAKSKKTGKKILFGNYYTGYEARALNLEVSAKCNNSFAFDIFAPVSARNFSPVHNLTSNLLSFHIPERPCLSDISFYISRNNSIYFNSLNSCERMPLLPGLNSFTLSANLATINVNGPDQILWYYGGFYLGTGYSIDANLSADGPSISSLSVFVSAASARYGNFPLFNYEDKLDICFVPATSFFSFDIWPEYRWNGANKVAITTPSNSVAVSAYGRCHTECFNISATEGFNTYECEIDGVITTHNTNTFKRCVSAETTKTSCVKVSAYNDCYLKNCGASEQNYFQTNNSSKLKQCINFIDYPNASNNSTISDNVFNLNNLNDRAFNLTLKFDYTNSPVKILNGDCEIKIDLDNTFVTFDGNNNMFSGEWTLENQDSLFYIEENTFNVKNIVISPSGYKIIPNGDYCPKYEVISSKTLPVSVYHGPEIAFFLTQQCVTTGAMLTGFNHTENFTNNFGYSSFKIDFGDGTTKAFPASTENFFKSYSALGTYTWNITGTFLNRDTNTVIYKDFILVQPNCEARDESTIIREFPTKFELPYKCCDLQEIGNKWATANEVNRLLEKINANFEYLKNNTVIYNPNLPNYYVGWIGNKKSTKLKYNYKETQNYDQFIFTDLKDTWYDNNRFYAINGRNVILVIDGYYPQVIYNSPNITEGELFEEPVAIRYSLKYDEIYILDKKKNAFYIFNYDLGVLKLKYYFGGLGSASVGTKFNNPNDFTIGINDNIVVCDTSNTVLKTYTRFLNWTSTKLLDYAPISITFDGSNYYVASTKTIYKYDFDWNLITQWDSLYNDIIKIEYNLENIGNLYVVSQNHIEVFNSYGVRKGEYNFGNERNYTSVAYKDKNAYFSENNKIHKVCECQQYLSLGDIDCKWPIEAIKFKPEELRQAIIYQDSFAKIWDNFNSLKDSLAYQFVEYIDPFTGNFDSFERIPLTTSAILLEYPTFGLNEDFDFNTLSREINKVCENTQTLANLIKGQIKYKDYVLSGCNTWLNMMSYGYEDFGAGKAINSLSWYELVNGVATLDTNIRFKSLDALFARASAGYNIKNWGNYVDVPYSTSACDYMKTLFTQVSCNSAQNIIRISIENNC